jgi:radical SAM protein with 4Fe4S-binding SPASM domain
MFYHSDGNVYPCCKLAGNNDFNLGKTNDDENALSKKPFPLLKDVDGRSTNKNMKVINQLMK